MGNALMTMGAGPGDVEDGTYDLTCTGVEAKTFPGKVHPQYNPEGHDSDVFVWTFFFTGGDEQATIQGVTSRMTGPKAKTSRFVGALLGEKALQPNASYNAPDFVGKRALGQIVHNNDGYPKVNDLFPLPKGAAVTGHIPTPPTPKAIVEAQANGSAVESEVKAPPAAGASIRAQAGESDGDLPF